MKSKIEYCSLHIPSSNLKESIRFLLNFYSRNFLVKDKYEYEK